MTYKIKDLYEYERTEKIDRTLEVHSVRVNPKSTKVIFSKNGSPVSLIDLKFFRVIDYIEHTKNANLSFLEPFFLGLIKDAWEKTKEVHTNPCEFWFSHYSESNLLRNISETQNKVKFQYPERFL